MAECQKQMRLDGRAYPRTCQVCGLGPCVMNPTGPIVPVLTPGGITHVTDMAQAHIRPPITWEPTQQLRWYRPVNGHDGDLHLEQLWTRGGSEEWRDVPTVLAD